MENYSVLMSVYYKEKPEYLQQSIQSMLDQTVPPNDFVLVCDGPLTPELDIIIKKYDSEKIGLFQVIRLPQNKGLGQALNEGMKYCKNEIIARMDSDDISYLDRCERQLKVIDEYQIDIVSGTVAEFIDTPEFIIAKRVLPKNEKDILKFARTRCPFNHPCVMYKKNAVLNSGGYQHFYLYEDYDLWVRMLLHHKRGFNIEDPILYMRVGNGLYERRGGWDYVKATYLFRKKMRSIKFCTVFEFLTCIVTQFIVCLLPTQLRKIFYLNFLRNA